MKRVGRHFLVLYMSTLTIFSTAVSAATFHADVVVENTEVFTGEPFNVQVQVSGRNHPARPDLSMIPGFEIVFRGGQQNSSNSVTIINGKMTRNVRKGYVFSYQFTPRHTGRITIPAIAVHADGEVTRTQPISIHVREPVESESFKLRINLSKTACYVGEPVVLTVTSYLGEDVQSFKVTLPLLEKKALFTFVNPKLKTDPNKQYYRIPLVDGEVVAEKGTGRLDGKAYATLSFKKVLIPQKAGDIFINPATLACEALAGYQKQRSPFGNDLFSDFFNDDFLGMGRKGVYRKVVVPSNSTELHVTELPVSGRPGDFSGNVGHFKISVAASPIAVSVGDPITLKVTLSGPDYLEQAVLPPLQSQPALLRDFKIPNERAAGEISGKSKTFTQTIRPLRPDIREIPSIALPYFDTLEKSYKVARSQPIPIHVKNARIVTAQDAEGLSTPFATAGSKVDTWAKGIAYNYAVPDILANQIHDPVSWLTSPGGLAVLILPPVLYCALLSLTLFIRRRKSDPLSLRARRADSKLEAALKKVPQASSDQEKINVTLAAFRQYLGDKLKMPAAALTFNDVKGLLKDCGVEQGTLESLKSFFETCEAGRYSGNSGLVEVESLMQAALALKKQLNRHL